MFTIKSKGYTFERLNVVAVVGRDVSPNKSKEYTIELLYVVTVVERDVFNSCMLWQSLSEMF